MAAFTGSFCLDLLGIIVALLAVAVAYMKWSFTYWKRRNIYNLPPSVPFGNALNMVIQKISLGEEVRNFYDILKAKNLPYGGYYFFTKPIFVPRDLDLVKDIMTKDFQHFTDHVNYVDEKAEPITGHLFSLKGVKWRNLRTKLTPTFTSGKMKMMFQTVVDCSRHLTTVIDEDMRLEGTINFKDIFARYTTDIISSCAFGLECNSLENPRSEFREYGRKFFETTKWRGAVRLFVLTMPEILKYFKVRAFREDVSEFFTNMVTETVNYRETNNIIRKDFMHLMIQLKNNVKIKENDDVGELKNQNAVNSTSQPVFTINEMIAQSLLFFLAGFETSSTTSTFCLYELAQQQQIQEKIRQEIRTVLAKYDGKITYEGMMEMTYMEKCIQETLRKYPPLPVHTRACTQTYKVPNSDLIIPKGAFVFIPVLGIQRDPSIYPDPDKFDPERFSEANKANRHSSAWIPFGDGPRLCIGLRFGMLQLKVGLTVLLKNYKFVLNPKTEVPPSYDPKIPLILTAQKDVFLNAQKIV